MKHLRSAIRLMLLEFLYHILLEMMRSRTQINCCKYCINLRVCPYGPTRTPMNTHTVSLQLLLGLDPEWKEKAAVHCGRPCPNRLELRPPAAWSAPMTKALPRLDRTVAPRVTVSSRLGIHPHGAMSPMVRAAQIPSTANLRRDGLRRGTQGRRVVPPRSGSGRPARRG